jgi:hypothetical protein
MLKLSILHSTEYHSITYKPSSCCVDGRGQPQYYNFGNVLTCCISTLARLLLIRRNSEDLRLLSLCSRFCRRCLCMLRLASLLCQGSRLRPPVLIEVFSSGVERRVTWSPPESNSCRTCVWYRPCTASPLICVMRSPGRTPDSNAGLPSSTACNVMVMVILYYYSLHQFINRKTGQIMTYPVSKP